MSVSVVFFLTEDGSLHPFPFIYCHLLFAVVLWKKFVLKIALTGKESLKNLAVEAARKAIEMADVDPNDLDLILLCTSTPEDLFGTAPQVFGNRLIFISGSIRRL